MFPQNSKYSAFFRQKRARQVLVLQTHKKRGLEKHTGNDSLSCILRKNFFIIYRAKDN